MKNAKSQFVKCAMVYGMVLGAFWAFKYLFFIFSFTYSFFSFVYWGLTLSVPFLLFIFIIHSRVWTGSEMTFLKDWAMGILIYFFAALIVSLEHYVFYNFFAPENYISESFNSAIDLLKTSDVNERLKQVAETLQTPTPIEMTIQGIFNNTIYGVLVALPVAAVTCRLKIKFV